ncbi:hypothetical protein HY522_06075 [bacterium]|nr:hypothetical protein [bacterium]
MTAVVGLVHKGDVWIGADSGGVADCVVTTRKDEKVFRNGEFIMGFTSSYRMGQLLRYSLKPPTKADTTTDYKFMATAFIDGIRECLRSGGFLKDDCNKETGGAFLVGFAGRLYRVDEDFNVGESVHEYQAVGCGNEVTLGAMYATQKLPPRVRIRLALEAAERHNTGIRKPFRILVQRWKK